MYLCDSSDLQPDLVHRLRNDLQLNKGDRATYYTPGPEGYVDYPFLDGKDGKAAAAKSVLH